MSLNERQAKIAKFNRFKEVDLLIDLRRLGVLSSVTTSRPSSTGASCIKYNIKLKTVPSSTIEDMLTKAEAIVNSDAVLKVFGDMQKQKLLSISDLEHLTTFLGNSNKNSCIRSFWLPIITRPKTLV